MASLSNRERVGRALDAMAAGVGPWMDQALAGKYGRPWREPVRRITGDPRDLQWNMSDPNLLVWLFDKMWIPLFKDTVGGNHEFKRCMSGMWDARREWAHPRGKFSDEQAERNCIACWKQVIGYAEQKQVNLCLEHLNTRDDTHPMKGHPGYYGDDVDLCVDLIRRMDSPRMKLLFDVYHVQIMNGDVIRRIRRYKDYIGHYHTAGVPGRCELDDNQEINYPPIMRAILETGYTGFVAQEFIPTWPDKLAALRHAVRVCDV